MQKKMGDGKEECEKSLCAKAEMNRKSAKGGTTSSFRNVTEYEDNQNMQKKEKKIQKAKKSIR